jgi:hypothetical protein
MAGEVAHNVPVYNEKGQGLGYATVARGHVEIVFDHPSTGDFFMDSLLYGHCAGLVLKQEMIPVRSKNTS